MQLQEAQKGTQAAGSSERELKLEAQLVEARSIIDEQVWIYNITLSPLIPRTGSCPHHSTTRSETYSIISKCNRMWVLACTVLCSSVIALQSSKCPQPPESFWY